MIDTTGMPEEVRERFGQHRTDVARLQRKMRAFYRAGTQIRMYHGSTNSTRPRDHRRDAVLDISGLNRVIEVNVKEGYCWVEPNVPMKALIEATLAHGLIPPVVMEFRSITVGGGIQGAAGESSSFRYGIFADTCLEYEVMLGNGELATATEDENLDIFAGMPGSSGTVAVLTLAKIRLIPAKPFVRLLTERVGSSLQAVRGIEERMQTADFVDGIVFSEDRSVVMSGMWSDEVPGMPVRRFLSFWNEWFAVFIDTESRRKKSFETLIPIRDYLFRYNRGAFWTGELGFRLVHLPFWRIFRIILHPFFKTRMLFRFLHATQMSHRYIFQDCGVPIGRSAEYTRVLEEEFKIYPLWLCPLKTPRFAPEAIPGYLDAPHILNVGIWGGQPYDDHDAFVAANRLLEQKTMEFRGCKVLYAHAYYTKEEFWNIYNQELYTALREHCLSARVFPDLYEKTCQVRWERSSLVRGIVRALLPPYKLPLR